MRASSRRRARAPTARRFFALFSSLAVAARARPDKVGCDRKVSGVDIMTKATIMGATPSVGSFVTASASTYGPNDSITITLTGLASAAFAHASAGTATTISGFTAKSCGGTAQQYANSGASGTKTFTWTAPADLTSVSSVDISAGYAAGQGAVTRQTITLTRAAGGGVRDEPTRVERRVRRVSGGIDARRGRSGVRRRYDVYGDSVRDE